MKSKELNTRQRVKNLKNSLTYAVSNGFGISVISSYQTQLIYLLVEVAKENNKRRSHKIGVFQ